MSKRMEIPWISLATAGLVVGVSSLAWMDLGMPLTAQTAPEWGGRDAWSLSLGQNWRLMTAGFLHSEPMHLVWNLVPSLPFLVLLERHLSSRNALALTLMCLIYGHATGAVVQGGVSVGFSPALFGLISVFSCLLWREYPRLTRLSSVYLAVGLIASLRFTNVDLASHVGGIAAGLFAALVWSRRQRTTDLLLLTIAPLLWSFSLPASPSTDWRFQRTGLQLKVHPLLTVQTSPSQRCDRRSQTCVTVTTHTVSRRHQMKPWSARCASSLGTPTSERCLVHSGKTLCQWIRRGLYDHSICLEAQSALGLSRFRQLITAIELSAPSKHPTQGSLLTDALQAHRIGATATARRLYQRAMIEAPLDARLPFLAAVLETDFGNDLVAAERLALKATSLDAIHPDGKALLSEIRTRLER